MTAKDYEEFEEDRFFRGKIDQGQSARPCWREIEKKKELYELKKQLGDDFDISIFD